MLPLPLDNLFPLDPPQAKEGRCRGPDSVPRYQKYLQQTTFHCQVLHSGLKLVNQEKFLSLLVPLPLL